MSVRRRCGVNGTAQVIATVIEQAGTPVHNGTVVTFTGSLGSFSPVDAETTNGKATTTFRANGESGTAKIGAVSGAAKATEVDLKIGGAGADQVVVRSEPSTVPVTGGTTQIVASVIDVSGNPLLGAPVVFSADNGVLSSNSAVTNSAGEARTSLETTRTTIVRAAVGAKFATVTVTAVALPTISIALAPGTGGIGGGSGQPEAGLPTTFTVTPGTATTGNPIRNVIVDYGDGQTDNLGGISAATQVSHTYARPGTYRVTATVTDIQGLTNTASLVINVSERSPITVTLTATRIRSASAARCNKASSRSAPQSRAAAFYRADVFLGLWRWRQRDHDRGHDQPPILHARDLHHAASRCARRPVRKDLAETRRYRVNP